MLGHTNELYEFMTKCESEALKRSTIPLISLQDCYLILGLELVHSKITKIKPIYNSAFIRWIGLKMTSRRLIPLCPNCLLKSQFVAYYGFQGMDTQLNLTSLFLLII